MAIHAVRRRPRRPGVCVGIDLAGVPGGQTGVAVLRAGRLESLATLYEDPAILAAAAGAGRWGTIAINAPLTRPLGRCCLDDDCRCRYEPGTRSRALERELASRGVPTPATALLKVLARRGERIAAALRMRGHEPIEVYPFATLKLLGHPWRGKKTVAGRRKIERALRPLVPGLRHPRATEHEVDAVVCAYTAELRRNARATVVGRPDEGLMVVPRVG